MLLIDATNLSVGGGGALLQFLLESLGDRDYVALVNGRSGIPVSDKVRVVAPLNPLSNGRQRLLEASVQQHRPHTVLCFGNVPPKASLSSTRVVTYFQNSHLIKSLDSTCKYSLKDRLRYFLLRNSMKRFDQNTHAWLFQTELIRERFCAEYAVNPSRCHLFPFFDEERLLEETKKHQTNDKQEGFVYISNSPPHKNHARLLQAWQILKTDYELTPELHLTVPTSDRDTVQKIDELLKQGLRVTNHGLLERSDALSLAAGNKYVVFPSLLETIGLGLVEGCLLDCDILVSQGAMFDAVVVPSAKFNPLDANSIARSVATALKEELPKPKIVIENKLNELIKYLCANE